MSVADRVRQAGSAPEALVALAEGIDQVLEQLAARPLPDADATGWGSWGSWATPLVGEAVAAPAPASLDPIPVKVDPAELERAREARHQAEVNFEAVQARGPSAGQSAVEWQADLQHARDHMVAAQGKLRLLEDPGAIMPDAGFVPGRTDLVTTTAADGQVIVDVSPPDEQRAKAREALARAIDLPSFFSTIWRTGEPAEQLIRSYVLGGPIWLQAVGQEDGQPHVIKQLPLQVRQAMVADVQMDSPRMAWEFQRDVLKGDDESGATLDIAGSNRDSMLAAGGTPYTGKGDA